MGFSCGLVGLPNVGKSTLFNALTATAQAEAANFPFTTIEPNVGRVGVPDERLATIARLAKSKRVVPTYLEFVDIAGLVRGASRGEGLGNKFLGHIREVDAICHVLRCFESGDVTHVEGAIDPVRDAETVATELIISDLDSLEKRHEGAVKRARGGDKEAAVTLAVIDPVVRALGAGTPAGRVDVPREHVSLFQQLNLLSAKPVVYVCNVDEEYAVSGNSYSESVARSAAATGGACVVISAKIEAEIAHIDDALERSVFLESLGLSEPGLNRVIRAGYGLLDLITFFTAGPKEAHAWTVQRGARAPQAAGRVHSDMERGFIRAETISYDEFVAFGGEQGARAAGKMRLEGKDYVIRGSDVLLFRFNV